MLPEGWPVLSAWQLLAGGIPDNKPGMPDNKPGIPDNKPGMPDSKPGIPVNKPEAYRSTNRAYRTANRAYRSTNLRHAGQENSFPEKRDSTAKKKAPVLSTAAFLVGEE